METFSPQLSDLYLTMAGCGLAFVAMLFLAYRISRSAHPDPRKRVLLPMLAYFAALLLLMVMMGTFWSTLKYPEVVVSADKLILDGEEYAKPPRSSMRLESVTSGNGNTERILLVQTRDRKNWAFPEGRYDIRKLYGKLQQ